MSLKEKLSNFGANVLVYIVAIAFFTTAIGLGYRGKYVLSKEPNWYVATFGFIILLPFLIYFFILHQKLKKKDKIELEEIKLLVKKGTRSEIDLTELEIVQHNNSLLLGNKIVINKYGHKNEQISLNYKNKPIYLFYTDINKDNLKIYFALNPKTYLYVDKNDERKKYIDLEFLREEHNL